MVAHHEHSRLVVLDEPIAPLDIVLERLILLFSVSLLAVRTDVVAVTSVDANIWLKILAEGEQGFSRLLVYLVSVVIGGIDELDTLGLAHLWYWIPQYLYT